jgi:hypothetical protein
LYARLTNNGGPCSDEELDSECDEELDSECDEELDSECDDELDSDDMSF